MRIKNWTRFQHYKHRSPPWIKLHRSLLDDKEWNDLSGDASKLLANCWLLASEHDGELPSAEWVAWRLRMDVKHVKKLIPQLNHWLEHDASDLLAGDKQNVTTETEKSRVEGNASKTLARGKNKSSRIPPFSEAHLAAAKGIGLSEAAANRQYEKFTDYHTSKGSSFANWDAAWRTWLGNHLEWKGERIGRAPDEGEKVYRDLSGRKLEII